MLPEIPIKLKDKKWGKKTGEKNDTKQTIIMKELKWLQPL